AVALGLDPRDISGLAVQARAVQTQTATLPDGEPIGTAVLTDDLAGSLVDDLALLLAQASGQPASGVAVGDEADVVGVGLLGHGEAALGSLLADLRLGRVTEGEEGTGELLLVEHAKDIGLVL